MQLVRRIYRREHAREAKRAAKEIGLSCVGPDTDYRKVRARKGQSVEDKGAPYALSPERLQDEQATQSADAWISGMGITIEAADPCERMPMMRAEEGFARPGKAILSGVPLVPKNLDEPKAFDKTRFDELLEPRGKLGVPRDNEVESHPRSHVSLPDG